jgi:hypothetical protein
MGLYDRAAAPAVRRAHWQPNDDARLLADIAEFRTPDGKIRILDVAARLERSADAVVGRLKARHGMDDVVGLLFVPPMPTMRSCVVVPTPTVRRARVSTAMVPRMRPCLRCQRAFVSEGFHNRMCLRCRTDCD